MKLREELARALAVQRSLDWGRWGDVMLEQADALLAIVAGRDDEGRDLRLLSEVVTGVKNGLAETGLPPSAWELAARIVNLRKEAARAKGL